jgi:hypothetical protein
MMLAGGEGGAKRGLCLVARRTVIASTGAGPVPPALRRG